MVQYDERQLLTLGQIPVAMRQARMPTRSRASIWRWATKGFGADDPRGRRVLLRTIVIGGRRHTNLEYIRKFFQDCAELAELIRE